MDSLFDLVISLECFWVLFTLLFVVGCLNFLGIGFVVTCDLLGGFSIVACFLVAF